MQAGQLFSGNICLARRISYFYRLSSTSLSERLFGAVPFSTISSQNLFRPIHPKRIDLSNYFAKRNYAKLQVLPSEEERNKQNWQLVYVDRLTGYWEMAIAIYGGLGIVLTTAFALTFNIQETRDNFIQHPFMGTLFIAVAISFSAFLAVASRCHVFQMYRQMPYATTKSSLPIQNVPLKTQSTTYHIMCLDYFRMRPRCFTFEYDEVHWSPPPNVKKSLLYFLYTRTKLKNWKPTIFVSGRIFALHAEHFKNSDERDRFL